MCVTARMAAQAEATIDNTIHVDNIVPSPLRPSPMFYASNISWGRQTHFTHNADTRTHPLRRPQTNTLGSKVTAIYFSRWVKVYELLVKCDRDVRYTLVTPTCCVSAIRDVDKKTV
jgi:hypothetical protein